MGSRATADDLGSLAGRLAKIGADIRELKPRLDLRRHGPAGDYAAALGGIITALSARRRLEVHEQGGVAAPATDAPGSPHSRTQTAGRGRSGVTGYPGAPRAADSAQSADRIREAP
jgi:hypothetical protein